MTPTLETPNPLDLAAALLKALDPNRDLELCHALYAWLLAEQERQGGVLSAWADQELPELLE
jgi:hypothetical protein